MSKKYDNDSVENMLVRYYNAPKPLDTEDAIERYHQMKDGSVPRPSTPPPIPPRRPISRAPRSNGLPSNAEIAARRQPPPPPADTYAPDPQPINNSTGEGQRWVAWVGGTVLLTAILVVIGLTYSEEDADAEQHVASASIAPASPSSTNTPTPTLVSPPTGKTTAKGSARIKYSPDDGSIHVKVAINGVVSEDFIVDTGCTITAISSEFASKLGLDLSQAEEGLTSTANGVIKAHKIKVSKIEMEGTQVDNIDVIVAPNLGNDGLIGLNFLNNFHWKFNKASGILELNSESDEDAKWWCHKVVFYQDCSTGPCNGDETTGSDIWLMPICAFNTSDSCETAVENMRKTDEERKKTTNRHPPMESDYKCVTSRDVFCFSDDKVPGNYATCAAGYENCNYLKRLYNSEEPCEKMLPDKDAVDSKGYFEEEQAGKSKSANNIDAFISEASKLYSVPEPLIRAIIKTESDFNPNLVSSAGARGLMQLTPEAARDMGVSSIHDPRENILGGTRLLRVLANKNNGEMASSLVDYLDENKLPPSHIRTIFDNYYHYKAASELE